MREYVVMVQVERPGNRLGPSSTGIGSVYSSLEEERIDTKLLHVVNDWARGTEVEVLPPIIGPDRPGPGGEHREYYMCRMPDGSEQAVPAGALAGHRRANTGKRTGVTSQGYVKSEVWPNWQNSGHEMISDGGCHVIPGE